MGGQAPAMPQLHGLSDLVAAERSNRSGLKEIGERAAARGVGIHRESPQLDAGLAANRTPLPGDWP